MKKIILILILSMIHFSCEGPAGADGADGVDGVDGIDGVANIQSAIVQISNAGNQDNNRYGYMEFSWNAITNGVVSDGVLLAYIGEPGSWDILPFISDFNNALFIIRHWYEPGQATLEFTHYGDQVLLLMQGVVGMYLRLVAIPPQVANSFNMEEMSYEELTLFLDAKGLEVVESDAKLRKKRN